MGLGVEAEGKRVFKGLMSDCWVGGVMVKLKMLAGLKMLLPQTCAK